MKKYPSLQKLLATLLTIAAIFAGQQAFATSTFTVEATTVSTGCKFTITRSGNTSIAETVHYRTVSLSALAGKHFTERYGTVTFDANQTTTTITISETAIADVDANYRYQDGNSRKYRFEVLDNDGYMLAYEDRTITYGTAYRIIASDFDEKTVTVSSGETTAGDGGYGNNSYLTMASSGYYNNAAPKDYLSASDMELHMTLDFQAKEVEDGYQYIQILFDPTNNGYDDRPSNASNGDPGTPSLSRYMAGFEHRSGSSSTDYASYSFPVTSVGNNAGAAAPWNTSPWYNSIGKLSIQKFNTNCRATDGKLLIPTEFTELVLRLNASGSGGDDWTLKNVVAKIQAVDANRPTVLNNYTFSNGRHQKGNMVYVSVPFSEIVYITGTTKKLTTSWGDLTYIEGNGTNVLTFSGEISSSASGAFNVTGYSGVIKDMADLQFNGSISCNFGINLNSDYVWSPSDFNSLGSNTYEIATTTDLRHLALMVNGAYNDCSGLTFQQTADIAFSTTGLGSTDENYIAIGGYFNGGDKSFSGTYDGQNHTISNIRLYKPQTNQNANKNQALFGRAVNATVKNVTLVEAKITGYRIVGGIVGLCQGSTVQNCLVVNSGITCGDTYVGAVIARNESGNTFTNNHYRNCSMNGTANATNVGVGANGTMDSSSDQNGVRSVHTLSLGTNITATGESVTYQGTTYYASNTTITLSYNNSTGYQVTYSLNGTALSGNTFTMPANDDASVDAVATLITYNITYNLDGGSVATANPTSYNVTTNTFTLNNPTRTGYTFAGWTGTNLTEPTQTVTIAQGSIGDRSYTANWTLITYNITYDLDGGSVATANPTSYNVTTNTFTLNNPTKTGYTFAGWTGTDLTEATQTVTIAQGSIGDRSYMANWTLITYNITYNLNGGSVATANPTTYTVETPTFTLVNPTKTGCPFDGWTGTNLTETTQTVTITQGSIGDRSYTAIWTDLWGIAGGADGSEAHPYLITTTAGLDLLAQNVNSGTGDDYAATGYSGIYFKLGNNITYNHTTDWNNATSTENNYTAIGGFNAGVSRHFKGIFDGDGYTISGIRIFKNGSNNANDNQGLFGYINSGIVKNVTLSDTRITGYSHIGGIVGNLHAGSTIENCHATATVEIHSVVDNAIRHGGIIGGSGNSTIKNCTSAATLSVADGVTGCCYYGGIEGSGNRDNVQNCLAIGVNVIGQMGVGAIVGQNAESILSHNYYHDCIVTKGTSVYTTDMGCGSPFGDITANDGAVQVFSLTLGEDITATGTVTVTYNNTDYFLASTEITLAYSGTPPEGYRFAYYTVNNEPVEGNTFEMPTADAVVEAVLLERYYTYDSTTKELALIFGAFNKDNKWGSDVTPSEVTSVTATNEVSFTGSCFELFTGFSNCTSMDLTDVNTDGVTNMDSMFQNCSNLQSLDLSGWNTANVTSMSGMFYGCMFLQSLNLSDWNTGNVNAMNNMFNGCQSLTTLSGISGWDTGSVTDMNNMFHSCMSLESLDISNWNTGLVTNMSFMFSNCWSLPTLDVSRWDVRNVINMYGMFAGCEGLPTLDLSGWNTSAVTNMSLMFRSFTGLTTIYVGEGWSTENVTNSDNMFEDCTSLVGGMGTAYDADHVDGEYARYDHGDDQPGYLTGVFALTLPEDVTATPAATLTYGDVNYYKGGHSITLTYGGEVPEGYAPIYSVNGNAIEGNTFTMPFEDASVTVEIQRLRYIFNSTTGELALIWGEFNKDDKWGNDVPIADVTSVTATDEVRFTGDCTWLFNQFSNCETMDLSKVNTDSCTIMGGIFGNCTSLETLDLTGWNTENVTNMYGMFAVCSSLTTVEGLSGFETGNVTNMSDMFVNCSSLEALDLSGWNTGNVTNMSNMFFGCSSLTTLDLSGWDVSKVSNMTSMFNGCSSLTTLDVSNWAIGSASFSSLFINCTGLTTLDLSTWNTSGVTNMGAMFIGCSNLTTIYVGEGWSTENVPSSHALFSGCTKLVGGMGTTYDADHINKEYARMDHGEDEPGYLTGVFALTLAEDVTATPAATLTHGEVNLYAAGHDITLTYGGEVPEHYAPIYSVNGNAIWGNTFTMPLEDATVTVEVKQARYTYDSTTHMLTLNWGEFNKDDKWGDDVPIAEVTSVTATDQVSFTGDCTHLFYGFTGCESLELSNVNTDNVTSMNGMFEYCPSLTTIDGLSNFNTGNVTDMNGMFLGCSSLESLDLSEWDVSNVTDMTIMFGSSGLKTLDLSSWNTGNVTSIRTMFQSCRNLTTLDLSGWNTASVTDMGYMFNLCYSLTTLDLSGFNTGNVTNMHSMFIQCTNLESLDLSGWDVSSVTDMGNMFTGCSSLTTLDVSDWTIGNANLGGMFLSCPGLTTLDLSTWNTEEVTDMHSMFTGCSNLTTIYVGEGWSTENVISSGGMFGNCTSLVGGMGTTYDGNYTSSDYAHIDGGPNNPGYFSAVPLDPVEYIDADGNIQTCTNYIVLEGSDDDISYGTEGIEAWYVVDHDVTYKKGVYFRGGVNLILVDGATLNLVNENYYHQSMYCDGNLTVYVQSGGTGAIVANNFSLTSYDMIIHGGHITMSSNNDDDVLSSSNNMTINGGQISAESNRYAFLADMITINGGTVTATATEYGDAIMARIEVVINGGVVTANASADNYGINAGYYGPGFITLGWTSESDRITVSSYNGIVLVATGQAFTDEAGNYYMYYLTDSQIEAIAGQTLSPFNDLDHEFNITYVTNGGTMPDNYPATYTFGETVTLPIPVKEDNTFAGWYDNAEFEGYPVIEIEAGTTLGNKTFYALWKPEYTDVTYLDAEGQTQTVHAKVLYGIETELPGGVYTIVDDVYLDKLSFTGNTTIILPDYKYLFVEGMGKGTNDDEYSLFVNGNLTIYGQEYGTGLLGSYNVQISGDVAIYGGSYDIGYLSANNGSGTITLCWTALGSSIRVDVYLGDVVLAKDFMANDFEGGSTIIPAGQVSDNNSINAKYLTPYAETIDVSYIDENGATHTVNAHVLNGGETSLDGGFYTVIGGVSYDHPLSFEGNTTLIIPDDSYLYFEINSDDKGGIYPVEGNGITVNGDLAIYGQAGRQGYIDINATDADIYATGDITVSNLSFDDSYYSTYGILSGGDVLIAGGAFHSYSILKANDGNGTITLGYLTEYDDIECSGYEGTVKIRDGQKFYYYEYEYVIISGTLTAEEVAAIAGEDLRPYIEPTVTQTIALSAGVNWVSVCVDITLADLENAIVAALPGSAGMKISSQGSGFTQYNGSTWRGGLRVLNLAQMYRIEVPAACELTLTGLPIDSSELPITISNGNNWIAFPLSTGMSVNAAFAGFPATGDKISSQGNGFTQYNGSTWRGGLRNLEPGKGYIYNSTATGTKTLIFSTSSKKK